MSQSYRLHHDVAVVSGIADSTHNNHHQPSPERDRDVVTSHKDDRPISDFSPAASIAVDVVAHPSSHPVPQEAQNHHALPFRARDLESLAI